MILYWCNGGHYHGEWHCPASGFALADHSLQTATNSADDGSYVALLDRGLTEEQLLSVLVINAGESGPIDDVACGLPVGEPTIAAVVERNRFVLEHFPDGRLWRQLREPPAYAHHLYWRNENDGNWRWASNATETLEAQELTTLVVPAAHPPLAVSLPLAEDVLRPRRHALIPDGHLTIESPSLSNVSRS